MLKNNCIHVQFEYSVYFAASSDTEDFFMSLKSTPVRTQTVKPGTCPHGLPLGACPICSGMAGGNSTTKRDIPRNAGEMTYNQCAAIGAMLRAQKLARQRTKIAQEHHLQSLADFQKSISAAHQRLVDLAVFMNNNAPKIIAVPVNFVLTHFAGKMLLFIQNIPSGILNIAQNVRQKLTDISDKLAAIYGEMKNALKENFSKFISSLKKKFKFSFFVFCSGETDDEEQKIEEEKRLFELKTCINKLFLKMKQKDKEKDEC